MARTDQLLRLLLVLTATTLALADDEDGPPISPEEFAKAMADPTLTAPPPEMAYAIENSGEFQGDIKLTPEQQEQMEVRSASRGKLWGNGVIPYTISSAFTASDRQVIARAMAEYQAKTCMKFVGRTTQKDYVHVVNGAGCWSFIGRVGGKQELSLNKPGCVYFGIVIHEFMHCSGFYHEQSRSDRDKYVYIDFGNIKSGQEYNFKKQTTSTTTDLGLQYDYQSIMHYGEYAFTKNGKATIISRKQGVTFGQRKGFSNLDVTGLNLLYRCKAKSTLIELSKSNIIDHGGFGSGGAGPEYLLTEDDYWNPNPKPWFVIFDFTKTYKVDKVLIKNTGDSVHDVTSFAIESSNDNQKWTLVDVIDKVASGYAGAQYFSISGEARYWKLTIKQTASGFQPWVNFFGFFGFPRRSTFIELSESNIINHGGIGPSGSGPENLLTEPGFWNPNPKPWFVIFDFTKTYKVVEVKLINTGDSVHDVTSFAIESSNNNQKWTLVNVIKVPSGNAEAQYFPISGEGRYWKLTIKQTASKYQPWVNFFGFYGEKIIIQCKDLNKNCAFWAKKGHCTNDEYRPYMEKNCPKSCNKCISGIIECKNRKKKCASWKKQGHCTNDKYKKYMKKNCPKSCKKC